MARMEVTEFKRFLRAIIRAPKGELVRLDRELEKMGLDSVEVESTGLPRKDEVHYGVRVMALTYRWDTKAGRYLAYVLGHKLTTGEPIIAQWKHLVKGIQ